MLLIGLYIFLLVFIWLFFIIKKTNAFELKAVSGNIAVITKITFISLVISSIIGLGYVFHKSFYQTTLQVNTENETQKVYY